MIVPACLNPTASEALDKIRWHLAAVNSLTFALSEAGFKSKLVSFRTQTGRCLLMMDGDPKPVESTPPK